VKILVNGLLNMLSTTRDALRRQGNIVNHRAYRHHPQLLLSCHCHQTPTLPTACLSFPMQTPSAQGGRWLLSCWLTPASKTWTNHMARNCPGDAKTESRSVNQLHGSSHHCGSMMPAEIVMEMTRKKLWPRCGHGHVPLVCHWLWY